VESSDSREISQVEIVDEYEPMEEGLDKAGHNMGGINRLSGDWLVVSNMAGLFSISYMGCHPKPIDELHHFSRWAHCTTNQVRIHSGMGQNLLNTRI
jgi:hypothetical protein